MAFLRPRSAGKTGNRCLRWRGLLPYVDDVALYTRFKLDEPWDSPDNIKLLDQMPSVYLPSAPKERGTTYIQVLVGEGTAFEVRKGNPKLGMQIPRDFTDGTSNTIGVIEASVAVPWICRRRSNTTRRSHCPSSLPLPRRVYVAWDRRLGTHGFVLDKRNDLAKRDHPHDGSR